MAISHSATLRNTFATAVLAAIDAGSGPGKIVLKTAGGATTLAVIALNDPAGTVSGPTLTFSTSPAPSDSAADASGVVAVAEIQSSDSVVVISGAVTEAGGGGDFTIASTSITAGDPVNLTNLTYAAAP